MRSALLLCLAACCSLGATKPSAAREVPKPVCSTDFESPDELGLFKLLVKHELLEVHDKQGVGGGKALRVAYQGNKEGSRRITPLFKLPKQLMEATLVFDVKFDKDFQFVRGGKLLGLGPDKPITGGSKMKPEGWSARAMWRPNGLSSYIYCQDKEKKYGQGPDDMVKNAFKTGRYYALSYHIKLNDPADKANGSMRVYIDGKLVSQDRGIRFRGSDDSSTKITRLMFSTFHGGDSPKWAPKDSHGNFTTVYAYFDNLAVYEGTHIRKAPIQQ